MSKKPTRLRPQEGGRYRQVVGVIPERWMLRKGDLVRILPHAFKGVEKGSVFFWHLGWVVRDMQESHPDLVVVSGYDPALKPLALSFGVLRDMVRLIPPPPPVYKCLMSPDILDITVDINLVI